MGGQCMEYKQLVNRPHPYIIGDIGSNFTDLSSCLSGISLAKATGMDAVKFQMYTHEEMYGYPGEMPGELPADWIPKMAEKADTCGIDFMCTGFSVSGYEYLNKYVKVHKVASSDLNHLYILEYLRSTLKPIILSTGGGWGKNDIGLALSIMGQPAPVLLHCVSEYPATRTCLGRIEDLRRDFGVDVGYSDHSISIFDIPYFAVRCGAKIIEKHYNPHGYTHTPDALHSLSTDDFSDMIKYLQGDNSVYTPNKSHQDFKLKNLRRVVATKVIKRGDILKDGDNIGIFRTKKKDTRGASGFSIRYINGSKATSPYDIGEGISIN